MNYLTEAQCQDGDIAPQQTKPLIFAT